MTVCLIACSLEGMSLMQRLMQCWQEAEPDITLTGRVICQAAAELYEKGIEKDDGGLGVSQERRPGISAAMEPGIREYTRLWFHRADALVFLCAAGIAVRCIAPWISHKSKDPAVIAVDELGDFCIPLLSGHWGGANLLAERIAFLLGAQPVITTATDREHKFSVDVFARQNQLYLEDWELAKRISARILAGERVGFVSELPVLGRLPEELVMAGQAGEEDPYEGEQSNYEGKTAVFWKIREGAEGMSTKTETANTAKIADTPQITDAEEAANAAKRLGIRVTCRLDAKERQPFFETLVLVPKLVIVGIGCKRGTPETAIETAVKQCLKEEKISERAVAAVASIDLKQREQGLVDYCSRRGLLFLTYSAGTLQDVPGSFWSSDFVQKVTGVDNVCERSAAAASMGGTLLCGRRVFHGITVALAKKKGSVRF